MRKSQVTFRYDQNGHAQGIEAVVLSTQHDPDISLKDLQEAVMEEIIKPVLPANWLSNDTKYFINPTGNFVIGGPVGDCGLTGRKIIVDTYGGMARHGGGAFSGKDPSKVDRSASLCRPLRVPKTLSQQALPIAARFRCLTPLASRNPPPSASTPLAPGTSPMRTTSRASVRKHFDLRPKGLIEMLDLKRPIFLPTASYGHFGRTEDTFTWERTDRAEALASEV